MIRCDNCDVHIVVTSSRYYAYDHKFCSENCREYWIEMYTSPPPPPLSPPPSPPSPVNRIYAIISTLREYYTSPINGIYSIISTLREYYTSPKTPSLWDTLLFIPRILFSSAY